VERVWRKEGLKVPKKRPKRERLWLNDGSCVRLRPEHKNHVWNYDFVASRIHEERAFRMLNILNEYIRECPNITVEIKITSHQVIERLTDFFIANGMVEHMRSDNGPEFTVKAVRRWLGRLGVTAHSSRIGEPLGNDYIESFNGNLRDGLLSGEIFTTLLETKALIKNWRREHNAIRSHSSLGYKPLVPETRVSYLQNSLTEAREIKRKPDS
jgi:putative transposase